jgi:membrane protease YdiL (CAAX protease family)
MDDDLDKQDIVTGQRRRDLFEVCVFLSLIVPSMVFSFFGSGNGSPSFTIVALSVIIRELALTGLILFFLWRNGEPLASIGWTFDGLKKEAALGVGLFIPVLICDSLVVEAFQKLGLSPHMSRLPQFLTAKGPPEVLLACLLVTIVAVTEETIFRGYMMLRFNSLTANVAVSVLMSSAVFSLGHGYEGAARIAAIGVLGIILASVYDWRKSLIAPVVIHFLVDFFLLVLMPLVRVR